MIRKATSNDINTAAKLALLLWPDNTIEDLVEEFSELLSASDCAVFLDFDDARAVGFAQCQLRRDYVEGTESSPVGYLEGIYILPEYRKQHRARALLQACEAWALTHGCSEFASDCELDNETSLMFHLRMGFIEANRIICFTKQL